MCFTRPSTFYIAKTFIDVFYASQERHLRMMCNSKIVKNISRAISVHNNTACFSRYFGIHLRRLLELLLLLVTTSVTEADSTGGTGKCQNWKVSIFQF